MTSILVRARAALLGLVLLLAWVSPAAAADGALPEVGGSFAVLGMQVPLPGGPWHLVAEAQQPAPAGRPVLHGAVLASLSGTTVAGLVVIQAAVDSEAVGSGLPGACSRADLHWTEIRSGAGSLLAVCSYVTHLVHAAGPGSAMVWTAADRAIRAQGWTVPATWLAVGFRIADDIDLLDVRYYFNPDLLGMPPVAARAEPAGGGWLGTAASIYGSVRAAIAGEGVPHDPRWLASPWSPAAVAGDPRRAAAIAGLVAWAHPALRALRSGFAGRAAAMLPPPAPWSVAAQGRANGLPAAAAAAPTGSAVALWKTLSWRVVGSSLDLLVSFSVTGNANAAGAITFIGAAVNSVGYYLHELAWQAYEGSRAGRAAVGDLPPAGIDF